MFDLSPRPTGSSTFKSSAFVALLVLVTAGVALSPRLGSEGLLKFLRLDDLLLPIIFVCLLANVRKIKPISGTVLAFSVFYIYLVLVALAVHLSGPEATEISLFEKLLPPIKGIQYLCYFTFSYIAVRYSGSSRHLALWICLLGAVFVPDLLFGGWQLLTLDFKGYYGIGIFNELSPTLTGAVFFFSAIVSSLCSDLVRTPRARILWQCLFVWSSIMVVPTGSRGAFMAILTYWIWLCLTMKKHKVIVIASVAACLLFLALANSDPDSPGSSFLRVVSLLNLASEVQVEQSRIGNWSMLLHGLWEEIQSAPLIALTGLGAGASYVIFGEVMNAADSQLMSVLVSGGAIGLVLYAIAVLWLFAMARRHMVATRFLSEPKFSGMFWAFMVFSLTQEVFVLSKTGGLFAICCGLFIGLAHRPPATTYLTSETA